jgi:hypothetical protein
MLARSSFWRCRPLLTSDPYTIIARRLEDRLNPKIVYGTLAPSSVVLRILVPPRRDGHEQDHPGTRDGVTEARQLKPPSQGETVVAARELVSVSVVSRIWAGLIDTSAFGAVPH